MGVGEKYARNEASKIHLAHSPPQIHPLRFIVAQESDQHARVASCARARSSAALHAHA
jgi:hypothetical protein